MCCKETAIFFFLTFPLPFVSKHSILAKNNTQGMIHMDYVQKTALLIFLRHFCLFLSNCNFNRRRSPVISKPPKTHKYPFTVVTPIEYRAGGSGLEVTLDQVIDVKLSAQKSPRTPVASGKPDPPHQAAKLRHNHQGSQGLYLPPPSLPSQTSMCRQM